MLHIYTCNILHIYICYILHIYMLCIYYTHIYIHVIHITYIHVIYMYIYAWRLVCKPLITNRIMLFICTRGKTWRSEQSSSRYNYNLLSAMALVNNEDIISAPICPPGFQLLKQFLFHRTDSFVVLVKIHRLPWNPVKWSLPVEVLRSSLALASPPWNQAAHISSTAILIACLFKMMVDVVCLFH